MTSINWFVCKSYYKFDLLYFSIRDVTTTRLSVIVTSINWFVCKSYYKFDLLYFSIRDVTTTRLSVIVTSINWFVCKSYYKFDLLYFSIRDVTTTRLSVIVTSINWFVCKSYYKFDLLYFSIRDVTTTRLSVDSHARSSTTGNDVRRLRVHQLEPVGNSVQFVDVQHGCQWPGKDNFRCALTTCESRHRWWHTTQVSTQHHTKTCFCTYNYQFGWSL